MGRNSSLHPGGGASILPMKHGALLPPSHTLPPSNTYLLGRRYQCLPNALFQPRQCNYTIHLIFFPFTRKRPPSGDLFRQSEVQAIGCTFFLVFLCEDLGFATAVEGAPVVGKPNGRSEHRQPHRCGIPRVGNDVGQVGPHHRGVSGVQADGLGLHQYI